MQNWTQKYLKECAADEIALAKVHPKWRLSFTTPSSMTRISDLVPAARRGHSLISPGAARLTLSTRAPALPPHWRRDWNAAGPLGTLLGLGVSHDQDEGTVSVGTGSRRRNVTERYEDHPDPDAATMAAIVRAAVRLLSEAPGGA